MTFEGIFEKVAMALLRIAVKFNTTYNAVNIIVYYCLVPLFWAIIIDYKFDMVACSLAVLSFWAGILCFDRHFIKDCDYWFKRSQDFLLWFERIGWNYVVSSVIICVILPIIFTIILFLL